MKDLADVTVKDLPRLTSAQLLTIYNANSSKPVVRFADYPSALRRTRMLLESLQAKRKNEPVRLAPRPAESKTPRCKVLVAPESKPEATKTYHSVLAAFKALKLPIEKHQRFRRQIKLQGKGIFAHFIFTATY